MTEPFSHILLNWWMEEAMMFTLALAVIVITSSVVLAVGAVAATKIQDTPAG
jgi:hypothetical protein